MKRESIQFFQFSIAGNKEPFVEIDQNDIASALSILVDQRNHPGKESLISLGSLQQRQSNRNSISIELGVS
jgi:hypothetical protein